MSRIRWQSQSWRLALFSMLSRTVHICIRANHYNFRMADCAFTVPFELTTWQWTNSSMSNDRQAQQASLNLSSWWQTAFCLTSGVPLKSQQLKNVREQWLLTLCSQTKLFLCCNAVQMLLVLVVCTKYPLVKSASVYTADCPGTKFIPRTPMPTSLVGLLSKRTTNRCRTVRLFTGTCQVWGVGEDNLGDVLEQIYLYYQPKLCTDIVLI